MAERPRRDRPVRPADHGEELSLVARAGSDADAFGVLYERHVRRIYNYIFYRTGNHHDAEDLTARVFQRALRHVGKFEDKGVPFSAWLYRIAHNLVANWHRDRSRRPTVPLEDNLLPSGAGPHPEAVAVASFAMMERYGVITIPVTGMPGAACVVRLMMYPDGLRLGDRTVLEAAAHGVATLVDLLDQPERASRLILGAA